MSDRTIYDWIQREVQDIAFEWDVTEDRAFQVWCLYYVHQIDLEDAFANSDTKGGASGGDGGLDGWYQDNSAKEFHLWQCKWRRSYKGTKFKFSEDPAREAKKALEKLLDFEQAAKHGEKFVKVAVELQDAIESDYKIVINVGLGGLMSSPAQSKFKQAILILSKDKDLPISWEFWDLNRFRAENEERHPGSETLEDKWVYFSLQSPKVIHMNSDDPVLPKEWEVIVASLNGKRLGQTASSLGSKLFSLNVRFALNSNKKIKNIRESFNDPNDSQYFWLYNNGITMLCNDFEIVKSKNSQVMPKIKVKNPQIVNGCQTVNIFKKNQDKCTDCPSVLTRIIKAPSNEEGKKYATFIAENTNTQNPVSLRDLRSNDSVQKKLQAAFDRLDPPWFYERKRGEVATLNAAQKAKYTHRRKTRKITMEELGQSWRMMSNRPSDAIMAKEDVLKEGKEELYSQIFDPTRPAAKYLFAYSLFTAYNDFWYKGNYDRIRQIAEEDFPDSLFMQIKSAKRQVVAYSVSLTAWGFTNENISNLTLEDAKLGLKLLENFDENFKWWNFLLIQSFMDLLNSCNADENYPGIKQTLEKPSYGALEKLKKPIKRAAKMSKTSLRSIIVGEADVEP